MRKGGSTIAKTLNADGYPVYAGTYWKFALPHFLVPLYAIVVAGALVVAALLESATLPRVAGGFVAGYLAWTLFEYIFHRWMLHNRATKFMKRIFWEALHKEHHLLRTMEDDDHHGIHPVISMPVVLPVLALSALGGSFGLATGAGWALGYLAYEATHWVFHGFEPGTGLLRIPYVSWLQDMHEVHHLVDARKNYGFVTMFWDRVFQTFIPLPENRVKEVTDAVKEVPGVADPE